MTSFYSPAYVYNILFKKTYLSKVFKCSQRNESPNKNCSKPFRCFSYFIQHRPLHFVRWLHISSSIRSTNKAGSQQSPASTSNSSTTLPSSTSTSSLSSCTPSHSIYKQLRISQIPKKKEHVIGPLLTLCYNNSKAEYKIMNSAV